MKKTNEPILAVIEETASATFIKFTNKNNYLCLFDRLGASVILGFSDREFAGRWMERHYPGTPGQNMCRKQISIETASMLWRPHMIIVKSMDIDWNLYKLEQYFR